MNRNDRLYLAMECALILFLCAAVHAIFKVWKAGASEASDYLVVIAVPAFVSLLFVVICLLVPTLLAVGKLRYPLQVTLPIVYASLLLFAVVLWTTSPLSIVRNRDIIERVEFWAKPAVLAVTAAAQVLGLWVVSALRQDRPVDSV